MIKPALTAEEWEKGEFDYAFLDPGLTVQSPEHHEIINIPDDARHALAALALYGQSFGFTRDDVENLRGAIENTLITNRDSLRELHALADRIDALFPPIDARRATL